MKIGEAAKMLTGASVARATSSGAPAVTAEKVADAPAALKDSFERASAPTLVGLLASSPAGSSVTGLRASELERLQAPFDGKQSDQTQAAINRAENEINEQGVAAADSDGSADAARDRRKASADNIQKFLDILRSMNPKI